MKKLLFLLLALTVSAPAFAQTQTQYYTVPTIAALKAMTTSRPAVVEVVDANPGIFNLSSGACSAADDIFQVQPTAGTTVCYTRMSTTYAAGLGGATIYNVRNYGATGNGKRVEGCSVAVSSTALTCTLAAFTAADVGKRIMLGEVGHGVANQVTTIAAYVSATQVTLTAAASRTYVSNQPTLTDATATSGATSTTGSGGTFTTAAGKAWVAGMSVVATSNGTPTAYAYARVTSYSGTSLVLQFVSYNGSASDTSWTIKGASGYDTTTTALPGAEVIYGTDDTTAIQAAAAVVNAAGGQLTFPQGMYLISSPIVFKVQPAGSNILLGLFADQFDFPVNMRKVEVVGQGTAQVVATASMATMFQFTTDTDNPAQYGMELRNMALNGAWLATTCVQTDSIREVLISHNRINWCTNGLALNGVYGGHRVEYNAIMGCTYSIKDQVGDHLFLANSLGPYNPTVGSTAYAYYTEGAYQGGGNTSFIGNTFLTSVAPYIGSTTFYGVYIDGTINTSQTFRDYTVTGSEFQGYTVGVYIKGHSSGNTFRHRVEGNHTIIRANGVTNLGALVYAENVLGLQVSNNATGESGVITTGAFVQLLGVKQATVSNNIVQATNATPFVTENGDQVSFTDNSLRNFGQSSTGNQGFLVSGTSTRTSASGNNGYQSSGSYAQTLVQEAGSADYTRAYGNAAYGMTNETSCIGANSQCGQTGTGSVVHSVSPSITGTLATKAISAIATVPPAAFTTPAFELNDLGTTGLTSSNANTHPAMTVTGNSSGAGTGSWLGAYIKQLGGAGSTSGSYLTGVYGEARASSVATAGNYTGLGSWCGLEAGASVTSCVGAEINVFSLGAGGTTPTRQIMRLFDTSTGPTAGLGTINSVLRMGKTSAASPYADAISINADVPGTDSGFPVAAGGTLLTASTTSLQLASAIQLSGMAGGFSTAAIILPQGGTGSSIFFGAAGAGGQIVSQATSNPGKLLFGSNSMTMQFSATDTFQATNTGIAVLGTSSLGGTASIGATSANYFTVAGAASAFPIILPAGSSADINAVYSTKGTGCHYFATNGGGGATALTVCAASVVAAQALSGPSVTAASAGAVLKMYDTTAAHVGLYMSSASGVAYLNTTNNAGAYTGTSMSFTTALTTVSTALSVGGTFQVTQASPASGAACTAGQIVGDANYLYACSASGAWKRVALTGGY